MAQKVPATHAKPPAAPGRPKDMEKGSAILDAARLLFTSQGFDGTSMDQIAAGAGASKPTVYSQYCDKENLFAAGVRSYRERQLPARWEDGRVGKACVSTVRARR